MYLGFVPCCWAKYFSGGFTLLGLPGPTNRLFDDSALPGPAYTRAFCDTAGADSYCAVSLLTGNIRDDDSFWSPSIGSRMATTLRRSQDAFDQCNCRHRL